MLAIVLFFKQKAQELGKRMFSQETNSKDPELYVKDLKLTEEQKALNERLINR